MEVYAAKCKNEEILIKSSSGGIFSILATEYKVKYGVAMSENGLEARFERRDDDIEGLRGSKYLQASMGDTFARVKDDLDCGINVLFSGTGCQINGLRCFLGKDYDNLFCVDVICHGVPSPKLWRAYFHYCTCNDNGEHTVSFREKQNGWKHFELNIDGKSESHRENKYMRMFLRDYCLRPICYECPIKDNYMSDISLADFWGVEKILPEFFDDKGISLVIVRTKKGREIFDRVRSELDCVKVEYSEAIKYNLSIVDSVMRPKERDYFYRDLDTKSMSSLIKKYAKDIKQPIAQRIKRKIERKISKKEV